ncbi:MAG: hypothetical protein ABH800_02265 [Candidatus Nealsonbacteria bacterium]
MERTEFFRKKYPKFFYKGYFCKVSNGDLKIAFEFQTGKNVFFKPEINIKNIDKARLERIGKKELNNLVFHLGLMEIPTYWKAACSSEIVIEAGYLNKEQIVWWKDLIIKGMGQFFYENKIDWRTPGFLKIKCNQNNSFKRFDEKLKNRYLVPVGGGRDSIVTLEKLKKKQINCFLVNPTKAARNVVKIAGFKSPILVERKIDPLLLDFNKKGYLNGHTPFTAVLSFLSVFCAVLFDCKNIVFSNESSADEGNVKYLGKEINHQYAKSSDFEKKFKEYCKKYLAKEINYLSFLRKYNELEISKMFAKNKKYFPFFSSCNLGQKVGERWCCNCPKCLFVYLTLYPFLKEKELLNIFGKDVFENRNLLSVMEGLIGKRMKPFECVGTKKESKEALDLSFKKAKKSGKIPYLLIKSK